MAIAPKIENFPLAKKQPKCSDALQIHINIMVMDLIAMQVAAKLQNLNY